MTLNGPKPLTAPTPLNGVDVLRKPVYSELRSYSVWCTVLCTGYMLVVGRYWSLPWRFSFGHRINTDSLASISKEPKPLMQASTRMNRTESRSHLAQIILTLSDFIHRVVGSLPVHQHQTLCLLQCAVKPTKGKRDGNNSRIRPRQEKSSRATPQAEFFGSLYCWCDRCVALYCRGAEEVSGFKRQRCDWTQVWSECLFWSNVRSFCRGRWYWNIK